VYRSDWRKEAVNELDEPLPVEACRLAAPQLPKIKKHPGQIAAWVCKALDVSHRNGIALHVYHNGRNAARCVPGRGNRLWMSCEYDVHFEPNKIDRFRGVAKALGEGPI
jgi:hypothetical protein